MSPKTLIGLGKDRVIRVSVLVLALGAAGVWGAGWISHRAGHVFESDARISADMISISSRVDGWVVARRVGQGDKVKKGDVLLRVDDREARFKLAELEARASEIKAEEQTVATQIAMTENQTRYRVAAQSHRIEANRVALQAAEKQAVLNRSEHRRFAALAKTRTVSQARLEKAEADLNGAEEKLRRMHAELATGESLLAEARAAGAEAQVLKAKIGQLHAEERRVAAQIEQQKLNVNDRAIVSPISGVVDTTFIDNGEFVRPGQRLMLIHDPSKIYVSANIRETDLRDINIGAPVTISVDAFPDREFRGEITKIGDAATSQFALLPNPNPSGNFTKVTQRIPITVRMAQVDGLLRPGMMVEIEIVIAGRKTKPSS
ncbi:MAG: HlyD family secretion protein [Rhodospirillales bacterium]|nr:HlyD family secretion protein [Rhodospirillales bacterium]